MKKKKKVIRVEIKSKLTTDVLIILIMYLYRDEITSRFENWVFRYSAAVIYAYRHVIMPLGTGDVEMSNTVPQFLGTLTLFNTIV